MNTPNKISIVRILLLPVFLFFYLATFIPFGIGKIIAFVVFLFAEFTDFLDGYLARKNNQVTDFGKFLDAIADKVLVNSTLIIFACNGVISPVIPVVIIFRDTIVDSIRMIASNKGVVIAAGSAGKAKTMCMMIGLTLVYFYNLPFEIWNLDVARFLLIIATVLSIYSGLEYYYKNKKVIFD